jgi:hypothetical protein
MWKLLWPDSRPADMRGSSGCAGVNLTEITRDEVSTAFLIRIFDQNIVFEDSVLDGLEPGPSVDAGVISIRNSTVSFVRLTVRSCTLTGEASSVLSLGPTLYAKHESLSILDSYFTRNRGNTTLGLDGYLVSQNSGKLVINNTQFTDNIAIVGGQVNSYWVGNANDTFGLAMHACTFRYNSGGTRGCVYVLWAPRSEVVDCSFINNRVARGTGGALQVSAPDLP